MPVTIEADPLTLSNACDGIIEERFQGHLQEVHDLIAEAECDPRRFESKKGSLTCKVTIELTIEHQLGDGITAITGKTRLKTPATTAVRRSAMLRGRSWLVEPPAGVQEALPLHHGPRAIEQE